MNGSKMKENVAGLTLDSGSFLDTFWGTQHLPLASPYPSHHNQGKPVKVYPK